MSSDARNSRAQYVYDVTTTGGDGSLPERLDEIMFGLEFVKSVESGWAIEDLGDGQLKITFVSDSVWSSAAHAKAILEKFFGANTTAYTTLIVSTPSGPKE